MQKMQKMQKMSNKSKKNIFKNLNFFAGDQLNYDSNNL